MRPRLFYVLALLPCLHPARAVTPAGLVYESEDISEPQDAWLKDQRSPNHWCLWTQEQDIDQKRSRGASLASPTTPADRKRPEDGAPPLHSTVTGLQPGWYAIFVSPPGRPLGYSLDGKTWLSHAGGELSLGVKELRDGRFELWVDDRYANPPNAPGSGYYDYLRFVPVSAAAANVDRRIPWNGIVAWAKAGGQGWDVDACDLKLSGFAVEYGARIKGTEQGQSFAYVFPKAGRFYVAAQLTDSANGTEGLDVTLNGKQVGEWLGDQRGDLLLCLKQPLDVKPGDTLSFTAKVSLDAYRVQRLLLSTRAIVQPPPRIENLEVWSPAPGEAGFCWTTSAIAATGCVEYGAPGKLDTRTAPSPYSGRNHRVILTGLDPAQRLEARVVSRNGESDVRSATVKFVAAPPRPPATRRQSIPLTIPEPTGTPRDAWPVTCGVPFARGALAAVGDLRLSGVDGNPVTLQAGTFSRWPDGSVKWATLAFLASTRGGGYRLDAAPQAAPPAAQMLAVADTPDAWRVRSAALAFDVGKKLPALFANVGIDRNHDGAITDDERVTGKPIGANLRLDTADGKLLTMGAPTRFAVEDNGPVTARLMWTGALVDLQGNPHWWYLTRVQLWAGQPWMQVSITVGDDSPTPTFESIGMLALRAPLDPGAAVQGGFDGGAPATPPDPDGLWLQQDTESRYRTRAGAGGERSLGVASAFDARTRITAVMPDFWQRYPKGFAVKPDGLHIRLLPPLDPAVYETDTDRKDYYRTLAWLRDGRYRFRAGQVVQQEVDVRYAPAGDPADDRTFADWCNHPLLPQPPADYLCATGVLGRAVFPRTAGVWDAYDTWFDRGYLRTEQDRIANRTFGWMSYGDWFGERVMNHGNNEYGLDWACAVQWLRCLDRRYFDRGLEMARHYATTDTLWGAPFDQLNGLVYAHSYNHVGTDLPVDSPLLGTGDVAAYAKRFGQGFFAGVVDRQGHIYQEGNWLYAALTGDPFLRECAERVCANQAEKLTPAFDYDIERSGGWPLINAVAAYNFSGNPYYLNAARLMIERTLERQEARTGGFPHFHYGSETEGKQLLGGKAFAVGILTHGMLRYLEQEPRPRPDVEHSLVRAADWLIEESWVPPDKGFRYITNAPNFANSGDRSLTVVQDNEVIAYAFEKTKDKAYRDFWQKMMAGQFDGSPSGMGKSFSMATRQTVFGLDRMSLLGVTAAPKEAK